MTSGPEFPDDENGAVLRAMHADGVDLVSPRFVDFEHGFPDETSARGFRDAVKNSVSQARLFAPAPGGTKWEVQCRQRMVPTHAAITEVEARLGARAQEFGGYADGWGSLSKPDGSPAA